MNERQRKIEEIQYDIEKNLINEDRCGLDIRKIRLHIKRKELEKLDIQKTRIELQRELESYLSDESKTPPPPISE